MFFRPSVIRFEFDFSDWSPVAATSDGNRDPVPSLGAAKFATVLERLTTVWERVCENKVIHMLRQRHVPQSGKVFRGLNGNHSAAESMLVQ